MRPSMLLHGVHIQDNQLAGEWYVAQFPAYPFLSSTMLIPTAARELTLDAAQSARSSRSSTKILPASQIKKLLDSRNDREVLDGLRKVISVRSSRFAGAINHSHTAKH